MPSFNRSVGSKSSLGRRNLNLLLPNASNCFPEDEPTKVLLHSSWIRRLGPTPSAAPPNFHARALVDPSPPPPAPPPSAPSGDPDRPPVIDHGHRNTISIGESRTRASFSTLRSAFFRRLLNFCRDRPEHNGDDGDGSRPFVGFGPLRVRSRGALLPPAMGPTSPAPPPPWVRLPAADSGGLDQDPDRNSDGIAGFGFVRQDSAGVLDRPSYANYSILQEEEEGKTIRSGSGIVRSWFRGRGNFTDTGIRSSSFQQRKALALVDDRRGEQFHVPLLAEDPLNHQEYRMGSKASSFLRSTRDEYAFGELVGEAADKFVDFNLPLPSGNKNRRSSLLRFPMFGHKLNYKALDQRVSEQHSYVEPWHGAASNVNGAHYISRAARGGGGYHDIVDDGTAYGAFLDPHLIHHSTFPSNNERGGPAFPCEPDEAFSYWNMGRYKRAKTVSSVFPESPAFPGFTMNRSSDQ